VNDVSEQVGHVVSGGRTYFKTGAQVHVKKALENFCSLNWQL